MLGTPTGSRSPLLDSSRSALDFVHRLMSLPATEHANLNGLLDEMTAAFGASGAGLATFPEGTPLGIHPVSANPLGESFLPWTEQPDLMERLPRTRVALSVPRRAGGTYLLTVLGGVEQGSCLLWLEDAHRDSWNNSEAALLVLAGQAIMQVFTREETLPAWGMQLDRGIRRQRMDAAAGIVRRLAHDFGNVLTGILGFSELALSQQIPPSSPLHAYLTEVHRGAQNGAQYTNQLRLFARRQTTNHRTCNLADVLAQEENRLRPLLGTSVQLKLHLPEELPVVAVEADPLQQALAIVLDNAREAITGHGSIEVFVRTIEVRAWEARELFGDAQPGTHLEIRVADTGSGLTPEAQRQLFTEPFFSTKSRKRGFGLAMAYGILTAHRGGLELLRREEGGTIARLIVPAADLPLPIAPRESAQHQPNAVLVARASATAQPKQRVLIVDDDPMVLQSTAMTLERAGFRIQTAGNAVDALKSYNAASTDPFRLVLSDVLMPEINGIELARRLIALDAKVPILFMSAEVPAEIVHQCFGSGRFELVAKPFRPEGLVRAVRAAIDRSCDLRNTENALRN